MIADVVREHLTPVQLTFNIELKSIKRIVEDHQIEMETFKDALKMFRENLDQFKLSGIYDIQNNKKVADGYLRELLRMQKLDHVRLNPRYGHSCACAMFWRGPCGVACRFAAEQEKPDGAMKTRPIDDLSWSAAALFDGEGARPSTKARKEASVNGFTLPVCEHA